MFGLSDDLTVKLIWAMVLIAGVSFPAFFYTLVTGNDLRDKFRNQPGKDQ